MIQIIQSFMLFVCASLVWGSQIEMTIRVDPGREECFYEKATRDDVIDLDYQVLDGGNGQLDIDCRLFTPRGAVLHYSSRRSEYNQRFQVMEEGDYKLCFDNTFSYISSKTIYFELIIENEDEDSVQDTDMYTPEELYEIKLEDIQDSVKRVHSKLSEVKHIQDVLRSYEARDRNLAERNFEMVNRWSIFQVVMMLIVGGIQVYMLRSLFDDKARIHSWKKKLIS